MKGRITTILPCCLGLAASMSSPTFAGTMGPISVANSWTIGGSALALQPALADPFVYAIIETITPSTRTNEAIRSKFSWGFDVFARYNLNQTGRDLSASYMGFWSNDTSSVSIPLSSNYIYNDFYQTALGKSHTNINAADILAGQNVMLNDALRLHATLGVGYANVHIRNTVANDPGLGIIPDVASESYYVFHNNFNGAGPKAGIDAEYMVSNNHHIGLVGGASVALLMGSQHVSSSLSTTRYINTTPTTSMLTNINGNIGLRYHADTRIPVNAEVGYKVYDYINTLAVGGVYLTLAATFG